MTWQTFRFDFGAACIGALATVPQAVAYGLIALAPLGPAWAVFGISASIGTAILFGLLAGWYGSHPFLLSGPRAVTALVLAGAIQSALHQGHVPVEALIVGFLSVVVAGGFQIAAGYLQLGRIFSYLPAPVLSGFVNASALLVIFSSFSTVFPSYVSWLINPDYWAIAVLGCTVLTCLLADGRIKFVPAALTSIVLGTSVYYLGHTVWHLPAGPLVGNIDISQLLRIPLLIDTPVNWVKIWADLHIPLLAGLSIGLLASFDTILTSKALNSGNLQTDTPNQDLKLHGMLNALMGVFGFLPGSAALSRSTAIIDAGAKTRMANSGSALIFGLSLIFLGPLIAALPLWATAGMIIATSWQALDKQVFIKAWQIISGKFNYPRVVAGDVAVTLVVVGTALIFGLVAATGMGVCLSILLFVIGIDSNPVRRILRGSQMHSNVRRSYVQTQLLTVHGHKIAVMQLQGPLFFAVCSRLQLEAKKLMEQGVEYLILDFRYTNLIDSSGARMLRSIHQMYCDRAGQVLLCHIERENRHRATGKGGADTDRRRRSKPRWSWLNLEANGVIDAIGPACFFDDASLALEKCEECLLQRFDSGAVINFKGIVASNPLFTDLNREQLLILGRNFSKRRYKAGEVVFRQGDPGEYACILVRGRIDVVIDIPGSARKKRVNSYTEGTLFGEIGLIDGQPRSATIIATQDSVCFVIDRERYQRLQIEQPKIALILLQNLCNQFATRLRQANKLISELEQ